ncbi:hypothetical protein D3C85_1592850 [compost metagenome]
MGLKKVEAACADMVVPNEINNKKRPRQQPARDDMDAALAKEAGRPASGSTAQALSLLAEEMKMLDGNAEGDGLIT